LEKKAFSNWDPKFLFNYQEGGRKKPFGIGQGLVKKGKGSKGRLTFKKEGSKPKIPLNLGNLGDSLFGGKVLGSLIPI